MRELVEEAVRVSEMHGVRAVASVEPLVDVEHVGLHRLERHFELQADLVVRETLGDQAEHFELPVAQGVDDHGGRRLQRGRVDMSRRDLVETPAVALIGGENRVATGGVHA
jgi:hypothetical protein